jgi:hypothetical protein
MVGDTVRADGRDYVVVFDGRQSLLGMRESVDLIGTTKRERAAARNTYRNRQNEIQKRRRRRR